ncbi:HWE histidine kinase domain-containing protein [Brenneria uluponensis]|uniref:HWE histidine kinase domain-containing protein n=1 Tax=Brenneria uluponensis TaxID=3057057 RepID=UPI0028E367E8|nr:HWE histidine kinase domain-containing protein [Brenneria ulupoensis]
MAETISIAYIGTKDKKRDTITGSRLIFPRHQPVAVEPAIAHQLLDFPTVWVRSDEMKAVLENADKNAEAQAKAVATEQARLAALAAANSFLVKVGNDDIDLAKLTSTQLATLVESEDLDLKQGAQEKVDDFRARVRDALKAKAAE